MGDYRSTSFANENMQIERYHEPRNASTNSHDFRSYSASYDASYNPPTQFDGVKELKFKKGKSVSGSSSKFWNINDPEFQRKRRVASYKVYSVEGKVKGSFKKSFRWLKDRYSRVIYG